MRRRRGESGGKIKCARAYLARRSMLSDFFYCYVLAGATKKHITTAKEKTKREASWVGRLGGSKRREREDAVVVVDRRYAYAH